jgi:hypothetical protein
LLGYLKGLLFEVPLVFRTRFGLARLFLNGSLLLFLLLLAG